MSDTEMEYASRPFVQINREQQEQQGCGLGIPLAAYLLSLHGGELSLHRPSEGSGLEVRVVWKTKV